ncbi:MAG TPA: endonuclease/exonuclease/phosphatase family protein [Polyangiaceae bacterium]|nr:endonuclease/exonuclease/phosphatase family protein [Polyangiaceae bacterium]
MVRLHRFLALALPFAVFACTANATFSTGEPEPDPKCRPAQCGDGASGGAGPGAGGAAPGGNGSSTGGSGTCTTACAGAGGSGAGMGGSGTAGAGTGGAGGLGGVIPPAGSGGAPPAGVNLRIVNFNAENLFDTINSGGFGESDLTPTPAEYAVQINDTAELLAMLRAEVIALEEVENREVVLNDLANKLGEKLGVNYESRWLIKGNDPVRNVALISTLPIDPADVISHNKDGVDGRFDAFGNLQTNGPFSFARDCLEVTVRYQGYPVTLFVVHYKAKSNDDPARRLAEARRTRKLVEARFQADPNARLVVLGDFNDTPESPPLQAITDVSPILTSGVSLLPAHLAWTHPFGSPNQIIDDQLASPSMTAARRLDSITVWHDFDQGFPEHLRPVSDHSPVAITYLLGDAPLGP